jgi:hypothetical protein
MEKLSTKELFAQLQDRLIIDLKESEILCPKCKGLRFILVEKNNSVYIESCGHCYTGKLYVCKHCGEGTMSDHCNCQKATEERDMEFRTKQAQKEAEAFKNAEKIHYKDYKGYYILDDEEHVREDDDLEEWIYEKLENGDDIPEYLWAVEGIPHVSIDLLDVISDKCEDGYEDMYSCLDTNSHLLTEAQELIEKWENEQGDNLCTFYETYKKAVIIKDLVDEIRKEIKK